MNARRVAALLRELAEALEQAEPPSKPARRPRNWPPAPAPADPKVLDRVRRNLRRAGVAT